MSKEKIVNNFVHKHTHSTQYTTIISVGCCYLLVCLSAAIHSSYFTTMARIIPCRKTTFLCIICLSVQQVLAFLQQTPSRLSSNVHVFSAMHKHNNMADDCNNNDHDAGKRYNSSRRDIINRAICSIGSLTFTLAANMGNDRANAIEIPSILISEAGGGDSSRVMRGMPIPSKKLGGLPNKIRSVSRIMVRFAVSQKKTL